MNGAFHLLAAVGAIYLTFAALMIVKITERAIATIGRRRRYSQPRMRTRCRMRASR